MPYPYQDGFDFDSYAPFDPSAMTVAPSSHPQARETSALAAIQVQPKRGTQNAQLMTLLHAAGETGLSDLEIQQRTGWPRQTICLRRFDLRSQLAPADSRHTVGKRVYTRWKVVEKKAE